MSITSCAWRRSCAATAHMPRQFSRALGKDFWREYDLPAQLSGTQLLIDRHFHLKPLAHLLGAFPSLGVVLVDRHRARLFDLRLGELTEREGFFIRSPAAAAAMASRAMTEAMPSAASQMKRATISSLSPNS